MDAPQVSYRGLWLDPQSQGVASVWSECGQKQVADAQGQRRPADRYARILSTPDGWQQWQRDYDEDAGGLISDQ